MPGASGGPDHMAQVDAGKVSRQLVEQLAPVVHAAVQGWVCVNGPYSPHCSTAAIKQPLTTLAAASISAARNDEGSKGEQAVQWVLGNLREVRGALVAHMSGIMQLLQQRASTYQGLPQEKQQECREQQNAVVRLHMAQLDRLLVFRVLLDEAYALVAAMQQARRPADIPHLHASEQRQLQQARGQLDQAIRNLPAIAPGLTWQRRVVAAHDRTAVGMLHIGRLLHARAARAWLHGALLLPPSKAGSLWAISMLDAVDWYVLGLRQLAPLPPKLKLRWALLHALARPDLQPHLLGEAAGTTQSAVSRMLPAVLHAAGTKAQHLQAVIGDAQVRERLYMQLEQEAAKERAADAALGVNEEHDVSASDAAHDDEDENEPDADDDVDLQTILDAMFGPAGPQESGTPGS